MRFWVLSWGALQWAFRGAEASSQGPRARGDEEPSEPLGGRKASARAKSSKKQLKKGLSNKGCAQQEQWDCFPPHTLPALHLLLPASVYPDSEPGEDRNPTSGQAAARGCNPQLGRGSMNPRLHIQLLRPSLHMYVGMMHPYSTRGSWGRLHRIDSKTESGNMGNLLVMKKHHRTPALDSGPVSPITQTWLPPTDRTQRHRPTERATSRPPSAWRGTPPPAWAARAALSPYATLSAASVRSSPSL